MGTHDVGDLVTGLGDVLVYTGDEVVVGGSMHADGVIVTDEVLDLFVGCAFSAVDHHLVDGSWAVLPPVGLNHSHPHPFPFTLFLLLLVRASSIRCQHRDHGHLGCATIPQNLPSGAPHCGLGAWTMCEW